VAADNPASKEFNMSPELDDSHDHGKPAVTIFVNTREQKWADKEITYQQVYDLAFPNEPLADGDVARIEYSHGPKGNGKLTSGESVKVKSDMVFDVYVTVRS
jgi:hypothetical protein